MGEAQPKHIAMYVTATGHTCGATFMIYAEHKVRPYAYHMQQRVERGYDG